MADTVTVLGGNGGIDLREFRKLTHDLKNFKVDKPLKRTLRLAGELIATDARAIASQHSQSIPPSIKVRLRKTSISVVAGGEGVPLGGLFELGNRGRSRSQSASKGGRFRHPVFGGPAWTWQSMHPYLLPATMKNEHAIERYEGRIVADAFREAGWI